MGVRTNKQREQDAAKAFRRARPKRRPEMTLRPIGSWGPINHDDKLVVARLRDGATFVVHHADVTLVFDEKAARTLARFLGAAE